MKLTKLTSPTARSRPHSCPHSLPLLHLLRLLLLLPVACVDRVVQKAASSQTHRHHDTPKLLHPPPRVSAISAAHHALCVTCGTAPDNGARFGPRARAAVDTRVSAAVRHQVRLLLPRPIRMVLQLAPTYRGNCDIVVLMVCLGCALVLQKWVSTSSATSSSSPHLTPNPKKRRLKVATTKIPQKHSNPSCWKMAGTRSCVAAAWLPKLLSTPARLASVEAAQSAPTRP